MSRQPRHPKGTCTICGRPIALRQMGKHLAKHEAGEFQCFVPEDDRERMRALYRRGASVFAIARETFYGATTVYRVLTHTPGLTMRPQGGNLPRATMLGGDEQLRTAQLYGMGFTLREVAELVGVRSESTVLFRLRRMGVPTRTAAESARLRRARSERQEAA